MQSMTGDQRHNILGVQVNAIDYQASVQRIMKAAHASAPLAVSPLAVHGVMTGALDATHRQRLNGLDMIVPDGQPVRWSLNWLHRAGLKERVYGPELMQRVCAEAAHQQVPIFLFGGTCRTRDALQEQLRRSFPGLIIAGAAPSQFRRLQAAERDALAQNIRASGAKITFVGIGCPRQETWAYEMRERLGMPILAVGAAFDFLAGLLPQAPPWMQRLGLEWCFRLWQEPKRLWRRYLLLNPLFLLMLGMQLTGIRRFRYTPRTEQPPELMFG